MTHSNIAVLRIMGYKQDTLLATFKMTNLHPYWKMFYVFFFFFLRSGIDDRSWAGSSQCCFHSDSYNLWPGRNRGIPHCMGRQSCSSLPTYVCHKCHFW